MPWLFAFCGVEGKLTREDPLPTHSQLFRWHVALVRIAGRLGDKETERRAALDALKLVDRGPQFSRHPTVGLERPDSATLTWLRKLAGLTRHHSRARFPGRSKGHVPRTGAGACRIVLGECQKLVDGDQRTNRIVFMAHLPTWPICALASGKWHLQKQGRRNHSRDQQDHHARPLR